MPRVVVNPIFNGVDVGLSKFSEVRTLRNKSADFAIKPFVAAALARAVRMAIVNRRPFSAENTALQTIEIGEFRAVVDGYGFENVTEKFPEFAFKAIQTENDRS